MAVPSTSSSCRVAAWQPASCVGTADERVTAIAYPTGGASNAQPIAVTTRNGNSSLIATTAIVYDSNGRVITADGPLSGAADTSRVRYNLAGQVIGKIGPDPTDGAKHPATRYTYNSRGQLID